jgi:phage terminase large subunit-like protein
MTEAEQYANDVLGGKKIAGKWIKLACEKFLSDLKRADIQLDVKQGQRAINFIERKLRHWEGSWRGKPLKLEDWQKFIVMQVFGWMKGGRRRVRTVYIQIARKNGKTSFAAAILLYHIFADKENTPQVLVGANNEDQAKICVNSAGRIIQQSPDFHDLVEEETVKLSIYGRNIIGIYHKEKDGSVKAMSKNPETQDGFNPSLGVVDEYHEAKDDSLLNVIESGQGARPEPLLFVVTTAGFDKQGPCFAKLRKTSIDMLAGKISDDSHLAFVYEMDEGDDWKDESMWGKSNPNLGVSVFPEYLSSRLTKALNEGATKEVDFKTKNLNMWVDAPTVWIQDETWMKNSYGINPEELIGAPCYGGLDLSTGIDLNSFCLYFPRFRELNGRWVSPVLWWHWLPKTMVKTEFFDYTEWVDKGLITITEGVFENVIDHKKVTFDISQLPLKYNIQAIAFDQRLAYHGAVQDLGIVFGTSQDEQFISGLYPFTQSMPNVSLATKHLETLVHNEQIEHFGDPVARWMMGNVVLKKDAIGQIMPDKSKSQYKIDGVAALINAVAVDLRIQANGTLETEAMAI